MSARVSTVLQTSPHLIRLPQVKEITGISRSEIYRRIAASSFPKSARLGYRTSAWALAEINLWVSERLAERGVVPADEF